jgi:hypothetical protein
VIDEMDELKLEVRRLMADNEWLREVEVQKRDALIRDMAKDIACSVILFETARIGMDMKASRGLLKRAIETASIGDKMVREVAGK